MASNNYFGFTHGGAQYGQAGQYQTAQTGYAVTPATYTTQRSAYETAYTPTATNSTQATAYATSYGVSTATPAATSYEYGYARPATATYQAPVAATYASTDYTQQAKPAYSTNTYAATTTRQVPITAQTKVAYTPNTVTYPTQTVQPVAATYSTAYVSTQQAQQTQMKQEKKPVAKYVVPTAAAATTASYTGAATQPYNQFSNANLAANAMQAAGNYTWQTYSKKPYDHTRRTRPPPKPQQLHYCEVCKISCGGIMTYKEHLEGQKHKKKEAAAKATAATITPTSNSRNTTSMLCELCDVTCTGSDAYLAHIRGAKHQKVVKLHTKLGKPIPVPQQVPKAAPAKPAAPVAAAAPPKPGVSVASLPAAAETAEPTDMDTVEPEVEPVGQDYIEEIRSDDGKVVFNCKLCECKFNDPNAKEMHMKGRRHRLQYKKKVDPSLVVDIKVNMRTKKVQEERNRRQQQRDEFLRQQAAEWGPYPPPPMMPPMMMGPPFFPPLRRPPTNDDRHVLTRHSAIFPKNGELEAVHKIVSHNEKALKLVSDQLAEAAEKKGAVKPATPTKPNIKAEPATPTTPAPATPEAGEPKKLDGSDNAMFSFNQGKEEVAGRVLKGAMRVGSLAKQLLLTGDTTVDLVVLCGEKPTRSLLLKVAEILPKQLQVVAPEEKYMVQKKPEDAAITVMDTNEPHNTVTITFTSPAMRETAQDAVAADGKTPARPVTKDPPDVLDKTKCLDALAALRHAKWFQARAKGLQNCVIVIRIFRDLCLRVPTWAPLNSWALELLVEKVLSSASGPLSVGDGVRRVLEAVSSGILLPSGPGLMDPCEKEQIDAVGAISNQQREDITASAQHALRLVAFRQIHKVLGMDMLPAPKMFKPRFPRKRRLEGSAVEGGEGADGKKVKDQDETEAK